MILKDGVVQKVPESRSHLPVDGFIRVSAGRTVHGDPFAGITAVEAAAAPADDLSSPVWDFAQQGAARVTATRAAADYAVLESGVEIRRYTVAAYEDAGSPVGYGFSLASV